MSDYLPTPPGHLWKMPAVVKFWGLRIGDTIEGCESGRGWWHESRLTLLWVGKDLVVWRTISRTNESPEWTSPQEAANWNLCCRRWRKIEPAQTDTP